ncbi:MAG: hypothetical protein ACE5HS_23510, partial [bacterium]
KIFWILWLSLLPVQLSAQSINLRFSTSLYSWERQIADSISQDSQTHLRGYQTAQMTIGKLASNRLSIHLYGLGSQDFAESADDDPVARLYNAYLQWKERKGIVQRIRLGRQRIYSGVAYGTIDGVDLTVRAGDLFKIGGFAGTLVPVSNNIEIDNWDDSHSFGIRVSSNKVLGAKILVSYMQRNRRPVSYSAPGRYTQKILTFESLEQRLAGVDFYRKFSQKINLYGRFDYDLEQERVRRAQMQLSVSPTSKLAFAAEFFHRAPLVAANSIFSLFEQNTSQGFDMRANYRFKTGWILTGNLGIQYYDNDESVRFGLGLRCKYGSFGYNFRKGYGGQNNSVYAALNYPLTWKLGLMASSGFSRYSLFDENADKNTSLTGSFGFNFRPHKYFSVNFLGQGVRNRFYSSDLRFFIKANYWFFKN